MSKFNINFLEPSQQQLTSLIKYYQAGQYVEAEKLSLSITQEFPKHQFAWKVLGAVLKQNGRINESLIVSQKSIKLAPLDSEAHNNLGVILKELGRLKEAETNYKKAITLKPEYAEAHNNLGITLQELGRLEEAEANYKKTITLKPDLAETYNNLGNILKEQGRLEEAETNYKKAITLKSDLAEAHNNLGVILQKLIRLDEAEESCRKAIILKPDLAEAHNNLGNTLKEQGRLEETMSSYIKAIELNPHLFECRQNLIDLLTTYTPQKRTKNLIVQVNQEINEIYFKEKNSGVILDDKIIQLFDKFTSIIKKCDLKIETDLSQVYRRNSIDLNCKRHKVIFNKFNIIPKFCFGCYKVQVEPRSILELIKLVVVFDQIKLDKNNTRKCMIEMRPEISGFYKGLIFCSSLEEAYEIALYLEKFLEENIRSGLHAVVKRGCSEYPISFPDYKVINKSGPQLMNYNEDWKSIEEDHDSLNLVKSNKIITPSLSAFNLQDVLIIRNWIDYAKGIGDPSVHLLNQNMLFSQKIYKEAKARIKKYAW